MNIIYELISVFIRRKTKESCDCSSCVFVDECNKIIGYVPPCAGIVKFGDKE